MSFLIWEDSFATGIEQFDEHHRKLLQLLNKTYDDFMSAAPDEELIPVLDELQQYATYHFSAEEAWMTAHHFPGLAEHRQEHLDFAKSIFLFRTDFDQGKADLSLEVLTFLKKWLRQHILESDADYARFNMTRQLIR